MKLTPGQMAQLMFVTGAIKGFTCNLVADSEQDALLLNRETLYPRAPDYMKEDTQAEAREYLMAVMEKAMEVLKTIPKEI